MNKIRTLIAIAVFTGGMAGVSGTAHAASEGCTAAGGVSCEYRATKAGGIMAVGNAWQVHVFRHGREITYEPRENAMARRSFDAVWSYIFSVDSPAIADVGLVTDLSALKRPNAVRPGDYVFVQTTRPADVCLCVTGTFGAVAVGPDYNR